MFILCCIVVQIITDIIILFLCILHIFIYNTREQSLFNMNVCLAGADSSEAARKILSLSNGSRPSDSKRHINRPASTQHYAPSPPQTPSMISRSPSSVKSCPADTSYGTAMYIYLTKNSYTLYALEFIKNVAVCI